MSEKWEEVTERALAAVRSEPKRELTQKTEGEVFDKPTLQSFYQLISHGHLDTLDFCVSTGKEANVFRGTTPEGAYVAVKVYRVFTSTFRAHQEYIWGDPRFRAKGVNKRELVSIWATKEFKNLTRYADAGLSVPTPMEVKRNILLMEFVGDEGVGAPLLKDVDMPDPEAAYDAMVDFVVTGWRDAGLVHGDLSEFNVLVQRDKLVVIDTAQAVLRQHPRARELLERDMHNVVRFFRRRDVDADARPILDDLLGDGDDETAHDANDDEEE